MKENYPLIDLIKSEQPPFWVYNNYAYMYYSYLESLKKEPKYEIMGDYERKPKLDEYLQITISNNSNLKGIYFIKNESFEWVEQVYYGHIAESESIHNWKYSEYAIYCFSANYDLHIPQYTFSSRDDYGTEENPIPCNEIYEIEVYDFESAGRYPDSQELDLLVKEKLRKIISTDLENFLNFHFNNCFDAFKFLVHVIEITDDIWKNSANDIDCKKVFKKWIKGKIDFLEISNPQVLIDVYITQKKIDYDKQLNIDGIPISLSVPFEVFYNAKLEVKIYEFFQLNEKNTPEPPQLQNEETEDLKDGHLWDKLALIHYLNKHKLLKLDTLHQDNTKIASVFSFLIGNSAESIRQKLSRVRKNEFNPSLKNLENILPIIKFLEHKELIEEIETEIKKNTLNNL